MIWNDAALKKLNELVKDKFNDVRAAISLLPGEVKEQTMAIEKAWHNYCMSLGIKMNIIPDHETETREDLPAPGEVMFLDGRIRLRNIWGDKYIDMSEEFAMKALVLGGLP